MRINFWDFMQNGNFKVKFPYAMMTVKTRWSMIILQHKRVELCSNIKTLHEKSRADHLFILSFY